MKKKPMKTWLTNAFVGASLATCLVACEQSQEFTCECVTERCEMCEGTEMTCAGCSVTTHMISATDASEAGAECATHEGDCSLKN